jgi:hypothetical protein
VKPTEAEAKIDELQSRLDAMTDRAFVAERRVARYQIAFCRFQGLIGDLCSADSEINYLRGRAVKQK